MSLSSDDFASVAPGEPGDGPVVFELPASLIIGKTPREAAAALLRQADGELMAGEPGSEGRACVLALTAIRLLAAHDAHTASLVHGGAAAIILRNDLDDPATAPSEAADGVSLTD